MGAIVEWSPEALRPQGHAYGPRDGSPLEALARLLRGTLRTGGAGSAASR